ncbi:Ig-like domain-containing protein [Bdellovibrio bacteriovorus]|uniref:RCC1 domain-containing protein n=1 Tax=Bdellovibrio bacteriovorus TaxID=959 RepID=UPI003AA9AE2C
MRLRSAALFAVLALLFSGCTISAELKSKLASLISQTPPQVVLTSQVLGRSNVSSWEISAQLSEELLGLELADFDVTNGTVSSLVQVDAKTWTLVVAPTADGDVTIVLPKGQAEGRFSEVLNEASNSLSYFSDRTRPQVTLGYLGANPTNVSPLLVEVVFDEDMAEAPSLSDFLISNGTVSNLTGSGRVYTVEVVPDSSNTTVGLLYQADLRSDLAGNLNLASNIITVAFNSNRPTVVLSSLAASAVNPGAITVTASFSSSVSGFDASDLNLTNATVSGFAGSGDSYSFTLTAIVPGTFSVQVNDSAAVDGSSNPSLASNTLYRVYDVTGPTVTLAKTEVSPTTQASVVVTLSSSEVMTGLSQSSFIVTNGTISAFAGSGTSRTFTVTAAAEGEVTVQLPAAAVTDVAGNPNAASNTLTWYYDLFAPTMTITSLQGTATGVSPFVVQFAASEAVAGFAATDVAVSNGTLSNFSSVDGTHWTAEVTPTAQGVVTVSVAAGSFTDGAGKDNTASSLSVQFDNIRPTVVLAGVGSYTKISPVTVSATFSENVTGVALADFVLVNATATLTGSGSTYTLTVTPSGEGPFSVALPENAALDAAGNLSQAANTLASNYDITPPTAVIVADAGYYNFDSPIPLTVTFSEPVTGVAIGDFTATGGSLSSLAGSGAIYTMNFTPSGAPSTGVKTIFLKASMVQDLAGNANTAVSPTAEFYYDNTAVTISLSQKEQVISETDASAKSITFNLSVTKPYDIDVFYRTLGTAVSGVDHDIPLSGSVRIPAGATSVEMPFQVLANNSSSLNKYTQLNLYYANTPAARFSNVYQSRVLIQDVDNTTRDTAVKVAISNENRCVVTSSGKLKCWGANTYGQVGDGTLEDRDFPVSVDAATTYVDVSVGNRHACGLTSAGEVKCWGYNTYSQLGDGLWAHRSTPFVVGSGFSSVSAGDDMTCGIKSGDVYCWGNNSIGQQGIGTTGPQRTVPGLTLDQASDFTEVSAGSSYACAINALKELYCWGINAAGELGDGTKTNRTLPVLIGTGFVKVRTQVKTYANRSTCALKDDKLIYCWGYNSNGQLGDGSTTERLVPTVVAGGYEYDDLSMGTMHACGKMTGGGLRCWGYNTYNWNTLGGLGNGVYVTNNSSNVPALVVGGDVFTTVSAGFNATCGVTSAGRLKCWGDINRGFMADPANHIRLVPNLSDLGESYSKMATGPAATCGITSLGLVKCWGGWDGYSTAYSIGDGTEILRTSPVVIDRGRVYTEVSSSGQYSCGLRDNGFIYCWGRVNSSGAGFLRPVKIDGTVTYKSIAVGTTHSCGITTGDTLKCWGSNSNGAIGVGTAVSDYSTPVEVDTGVSYSKVALAGWNTCGITTTGVLKCWGYNFYGAVGVGTGTYSYNLPQVVMGGTKFIDVSLGGGDSVCAISEAKDLYCWGKGDYYRLGLGNTTNYTAPQLVASGTKFDSVKAGSNAGCAIRTTDSRVMCWGTNSPYGVLTGTLGNNNVSATTPQLISDTEPYVSLGAPGVSMCGVTSSQALKCWGSNRYGGTANDSVFRMWGSPVDVTTWLFP